jgi:hypothetical protein
MKKFTIKLTTSRRIYDGNYYVEYIPDNEYDDKVKKCDIVPYDQIEDLVYLEQVRVELYDILEDMFGSEFNNKYEL